jgi:hypothetical protein
VFFVSVISLNSSSTTTKTTFDNFLKCSSVILVPSIINESDCKDIISRVSQIADDHCIECLAKGLADEGIVCLPTIDILVNFSSCTQSMR